MTLLKDYLQNKKESVETSNDEFHYSSVPGNDDLVKVSFFEDGKKQSVILDTFSEEQIALYEKLKDKVTELQNLTPQELKQVEQKLFPCY